MESYFSKKFVLALVSLILISLFSLLSVKYSAILAILPAFIGGILGVLSLYFTGNIANKAVILKNDKEKK